jgi:predicted translin family RNA/ssDNA-binding protein
MPIVTGSFGTKPTGPGDQGVSIVEYIYGVYDFSRQVRRFQLVKRTAKQLKLRIQGKVRTFSINARFGLRYCDSIEEANQKMLANLQKDIDVIREDLREAEEKLTNFVPYTEKDVVDEP